MMELIRIDDPKAKATGSAKPKRPQTFTDAKGKSRGLEEFLGQPTVLVFSRGLGCVHCMAQLTAFEQKEAAFRKLGAQVVFVTPDAAPDLQTRLSKSSLVVLSDPELDAFRKYGSYRDAPQHGVILLDAAGKSRWQTIGAAPYMEVDSILDKIARITP